jgi:hypothetical protein
METSLILERIMRCSQLVREKVSLWMWMCEYLVIYKKIFALSSFQISRIMRNISRIFIIIFINGEKMTIMQLSGHSWLDQDWTAYPVSYEDLLSNKYPLYCKYQDGIFLLFRTVDTIPTCVGMATEGGCCPFINMEMSGMCLWGPYQLPQALNTWCWCSTSPPFEI